MVTTQIHRQYRVMNLWCTTIISTTGGNSVSSSVIQLAVQSLGEGTGKFTIGDLIAVEPSNIIHRYNWSD